MYRRIQYNELKTRIEEPRDKIQVLSGPRQVGKSTLVKQVLQETNLPYVFVSADNVDPDNAGWIGEMWSTARARMKALGVYLLNNAEEYDYKMYYWRERDDEVDFIIDSDSKLIAIEVKSGRRTDNEGLSEFKKRFNPDYSLVVGSGGVPLEEFLSWDLGRIIDDWE